MVRSRSRGDHSTNQRSMKFENVPSSSGAKRLLRLSTLPKIAPSLPKRKASCPPAKSSPIRTTSRKPSAVSGPKTNEDSTGPHKPNIDRTRWRQSRTRRETARSRGAVSGTWQEARRFALPSSTEASIPDSDLRGTCAIRCVTSVTELRARGLLSGRILPFSPERQMNAGEQKICSQLQFQPIASRVILPSCPHQQGNP